MVGVPSGDAVSIFDLLRINGRDMWQVEKPEIFQCRNGERKIWVALIPVRAGESLNAGKCDTVWDIDGGERRTGLALGKSL